MKAFVLFLGTVLIVGCGSGTKVQKSPEVPDRQATDAGEKSGAVGDSKADAPTSKEAKRQALLAKIEKAQNAECERMCPRVTGCALEDAKKHLDSEKIKEEKLVEKMPVLEKKCVDECKKNPLSLRQLRVYVKCNNDAESSCDEFLKCMEESQPQS